MKNVVTLRAGAKDPARHATLWLYGARDLSPTAILELTHRVMHVLRQVGITDVTLKISDEPNLPAD